MRRICRVVVALGLFAGCSVESSASPKPAAQAKAPAKVEPELAKVPEGVTPAKRVEPAPAPDPAPAPEAGDGGAAPPQPPGSELAQRFQDPPWYRKTLFEGATVTSSARSEANEAGLFQSHIVFELAKDTTLDACVEHLEKTVGASVSNLARAPQPDGRIKLSGSTDRYAVTLLCGEAKGTMRAYVAFEWTS